MSDYSESAARFASDTAEHQMTVLHDDGLYRHLRFKAPGTGFYWFDLVTWPGRLSFSGDMDGYVFARVQDMFEFFRDQRYGINPEYWAEKVTDGRDRTKVYDEDNTRRRIAEHVAEAIRGGGTPRGLAKAVHDQILDGWDGELADEESARRTLHHFEYKGFRFVDVWEWSLREYNWSYLWACHAIQWGINQYDAQRAPKELVTADPGAVS